MQSGQEVKLFFFLFVLLPHDTKANITPVILNADDRILVLAPHPDDEVLGAAGVIQQAKALGLPVKIVFFTYSNVHIKKIKNKQAEGTIFSWLPI